MNEHETEKRRRFNALFASYGPDIVAYCGWRAGTPSDAQDAVSEVFLPHGGAWTTSRRAMPPAFGSTRPHGR
jgi:DNA-directed RNA polymerase specialized sigma24 family protein